MDFLKRELAPITRAAWHEIDEEATGVLKTHLTARRLVDVDEPKGFGHASVSLGRLRIPDQGDTDLAFGIYQVKPLVEVRIPFELNIWELDNAERGAGDVDLGPLTEACKKMATFEDQAIYHGLKQAEIQGVLNEETPTTEVKAEAAPFLKSLTRACHAIQQQGIEGPYALAVNPTHWSALVASTTAYPLKKLVLEIVDRVVLVPAIQHGLVVSTRGGDMELVLGQDLSVGYLSHESKTVKLFLTESFTFLVHEPLCVQALNF